MERLGSSHEESINGSSKELRQDNEQIQELGQPVASSIESEAQVIEFGGGRFIKNDGGILVPGHRRNDWPQEFGYAANRLPADEDGGGGLLTAARPMVINSTRQTKWFGAAYTASPESRARFELEYGDHIKLIAIEVTPDEKEAHKDGFSDKILWWVMHDGKYVRYANLNGNIETKRAHFEGYERVQAKTADQIVATCGPEAMVSLQDYHNLLTGRFVHDQRPDLVTTLYIHTPFAEQKAFFELRKLGDDVPAKLLDGMLANDVVGFSTQQNRKNFLDCIQTMYPGIRIENEEIDQNGYVFIHTPERRVVVGVFPISIDPEEMKQKSLNPESVVLAQQIEEQFPGEKAINASRLEPTKEPAEAVRTWGLLNERHSDVRGMHYFLVVAPSRRHPPYLKEERKLTRAEASIKYGRDTLHVIHGLEQAHLMAYNSVCVYGMYSEGVDGTRLTPLEFGVTSKKNAIVFVSTKAGVADRLKDAAILTNPDDREERVEQIYGGMAMNETEKEAMHERLIENVIEHDIFVHDEAILRAARVAKAYRDAA